MGKEDNLKKNLKGTKQNERKSSSASAAKKSAKERTRRAVVQRETLLFSKENYIIIGIGLVVVIVGMFLMSGGFNQPDEWIADEIYSFRRITLAPFVVLLGLSIVVFAIFKSPKSEEVNSLAAATEYK